MIIVFSPFFFSFGILLVAFRHQSTNDFSCLVGVRSCCPKGVRIRDQNSRARTHVVSRCWTVSSSWSHKGQWDGWGNPLLANRSTVQHLFRIASHKNNLHFAGAQDVCIMVSWVWMYLFWSVRVVCVCLLAPGAFSNPLFKSLFSVVALLAQGTCPPPSDHIFDSASLML